MIIYITREGTHDDHILSDIDDRDGTDFYDREFIHCNVFIIGWFLLLLIWFINIRGEDEQNTAIDAFVE